MFQVVINQFEKIKCQLNGGIFSRLSQAIRPKILYSLHVKMVLQLEQIPEGAVTITDGQEVKEKGETQDTGKPIVIQLIAILFMKPSLKTVCCAVVCIVDVFLEVSCYPVSAA